MSTPPHGAEHAGTARALWLRRLRNAARTSLGEWIDDVIDRRVSGFQAPERFDPAHFCDEFGQARLVDGPMIAHLLNLAWVRPGDVATTAAPLIDWRWWCAVHAQDNPPLIESADGPLDARGASSVAIETWTERELAGLHAAWHVATRRNDRELLCRLHRAAAWHAANTQPDNATNHPWAIHVFIARMLQGDADAELLAQTLLHNCHVTLGKPDLRSGLILADAAMALAAIRLGGV